MNIVVHSEEEEIKVLYQSLYYLYQHYQDIYDWFFIGSDKSYIAGYRVNEIVNHMSITRKLYMGHPKDSSLNLPPAFKTQFKPVYICKSNH